MNASIELPRTLKERAATYSEVVYTETAFRGVMEGDEVRPTHKGPRGCKALPNSSCCHEYLAIDFMASNLKDYKDLYFNPVSLSQARYGAKVERKYAVKEPAAYNFYTAGLVLTVWVKLLIAMATIFSLLGALTMFFLIMVSFFTSDLSILGELTALLPSFFVFLILPLSVYFLLKFFDDRDLLVRFNKVPGIRLALRRDTGMVQFKKRGRWIDVPFPEVMGMTRHHCDSHGVRRMTFHLNHKHSKLNRNLDSGLYALGTAMTKGERWFYHLRWEFYRHYMDTTRPLPDIPEFEPYRHLDPATREWDEEHGRPKNYWLNMDQETYKAMVDAAVKKAETYPYDDQEAAEEIGWTPAGDGKAWYQLG